MLSVRFLRDERTDEAADADARDAASTISLDKLIDAEERERILRWHVGPNALPLPLFSL